jgi:hypothetical protein
VITSAEVADHDLRFEEVALRVAAAAVTVESGAGETVLRHDVGQFQRILEGD